MSRVSRFIFSNNQFSSKFSIPEKNHPHRDTSVHFAASIFSPRDRDQPPPFSSEIHEKRGGKRGKVEEAGTRKRGGREKETVVRRKGEEHEVLRVSRKCFIHAAYAEVPSPPPSPRFTKRAHRQRVVSNFNYKPRRGELEFSEMRRACETKGVSGDQP